MWDIQQVVVAKVIANVQVIKHVIGRHEPQVRDVQSYLPAVHDAYLATAVVDVFFDDGPPEHCAAHELDEEVQGLIAEKLELVVVHIEYLREYSFTHHPWHQINEFDFSLQIGWADAVSQHG